MQVSSYLSSVLGQFRTGAASSVTQGSGSTAATDSATPSAADAFLEEAKKTPAQRFREDWLKQHNLTEESLNEMPAEQREATEKSFAEDLKRKLTGTDEKRGAMVDLTA